MAFTRPDLPSVCKNAPKPSINRNTSKATYSVEMLGALLGIPHEILRVSYDADRQLVSLYLHDVSLEDSRYEGQEPMMKLYLDGMPAWGNVSDKLVSVMTNVIGYEIETKFNDQEGDVIEVPTERTEQYREVAQKVIEHIKEFYRGGANSLVDQE
jgi:hypothetical protein